MTAIAPGESRWHAVWYGATRARFDSDGGSRCLSGSQGEMVVRIISARKADKREQEDYWSLMP